MFGWWYVCGQVTSPNSHSGSLRAGCALTDCQVTPVFAIPQPGPVLKWWHMRGGGDMNCQKVRQFTILLLFCIWKVEGIHICLWKIKAWYKSVTYHIVENLFSAHFPPLSCCVLFSPVPCVLSCCVLFSRPSHSVHKHSLSSLTGLSLSNNYFPLFSLFQYFSLKSWAKSLNIHLLEIPLS